VTTLAVANSLRLGFAAWAGIAAKNKGYSFALFSGFALVFPLNGQVVAAARSPTEVAITRRQLATGTHRACPHCTEMIKTEARICRFCRERLRAEGLAEPYSRFHCRTSCRCSVASRVLRGPPRSSCVVWSRKHFGCARRGSSWVRFARRSALTRPVTRLLGSDPRMRSRLLPTAADPRECVQRPVVGVWQCVQVLLRGLDLGVSEPLHHGLEIGAAGQ
jgi:hypothetical protein